MKLRVRESQVDLELVIRALIDAEAELMKVVSEESNQSSESYRHSRHQAASRARRSVADAIVNVEHIQRLRGG